MEREVLVKVKDLEVTFGERKKKYVAVKKANFEICSNWDSILLSSLKLPSIV